MEENSVLVADHQLSIKSHPTDQELLQYYLLNKVCGRPFKHDDFTIHEFDLYGSTEPWDAWNMFGGLELGVSEYLYFFTDLKKAYDDELGVSRKAGLGSWIDQDYSGTEVYDNSEDSSDNKRPLGSRKRFHYQNNQSHQNGCWIMDEYSLHDSLIPKSSGDYFPFVLCRIRKKEKKREFNDDGDDSSQYSKNKLRRVENEDFCSLYDAYMKDFISFDETLLPSYFYPSQSADNQYIVNDNTSLDQPQLLAPQSSPNDEWNDYIESVFSDAQFDYLSDTFAATGFNVSASIKHDDNMRVVINLEDDDDDDDDETNVQTQDQFLCTSFVKEIVAEGNEIGNDVSASIKHENERIVINLEDDDDEDNSVLQTQELGLSDDQFLYELYQSADEGKEIGLAEGKYDDVQPGPKVTGFSDMTSSIGKQIQSNDQESRCVDSHAPGGISEDFMRFMESDYFRFDHEDQCLVQPNVEVKEGNEIDEVVIRD